MDQVDGPRRWTKTMDEGGQHSSRTFSEGEMPVESTRPVVDSAAKAHSGPLASVELPREERKSSAATRARRLPRSVMSRVLLAFAVLALSSFAVAGWAVVALRDSAQKTRLVRLGYLPLTRTLRDLVTLQDTWNTQLNHITTARNPSDVKLWFDSALRIGRPKKFAEARQAITLAFAQSDDASARAIGRDLLAETSRLERTLEPEVEQLKQLFQSIAANDLTRAERLRDLLLKRGLSTHAKLARMDRRVVDNVDALSSDAAEQQLFAMRLLVALSMLTALTGIAVALYVRRVLQPLGAVTRRARDVASGDLSPRAVAHTGDEISELATAFESMVGAIAAMRERMLSTDRLATIGKMAAHVTHEIRNPLSSIALNVEMLEEELAGGSDDAKSLLAAVQKELQRLTDLTEQYLSLARHRTAKIEVEDLCLIVSESAGFMQRDLTRKRVELDVTVPSAPVFVAVDEMQIRQVLFNLLRNAQEAMPEGGRVRIRLLDEPAGRATIVVEDEGTGIEPGLSDRVFDPFVSSKQTGTGLGLAVTRQIVESHAGSVRCENRETRGARFVIELPLATGNATNGILAD